MKSSVFNLPFSKLSTDEFAILSVLFYRLGTKDILKITDEEISKLFSGQADSIGRDKIQNGISSLVEKKMISRKQVRDSEGKFSYNEIKIISPLF